MAPTAMFFYLYGVTLCSVTLKWSRVESRQRSMKITFLRLKGKKREEGGRGKVNKRGHSALQETNASVGEPEQRVDGRSHRSIELHVGILLLHIFATRRASWWRYIIKRHQYNQFCQQNFPWEKTSQMRYKRGFPHKHQWHRWKTSYQVHTVSNVKFWV